MKSAPVTANSDRSTSTCVFPLPPSGRTCICRRIILIILILFLISLSPFGGEGRGERVRTPRVCPPTPQQPSPPPPLQQRLDFLSATSSVVAEIDLGVN